MELAFIAAIAELVMKYGIPLAVNLTKDWSDNLQGRTPTKADCDVLRNLVLDPEEYAK